MKQVNETGQEYSFGEEMPIGAIVAVHPDTKVAYLPPTPHWQKCDGVFELSATFFTKTNSDYIPDLTDDRFIQGKSSWEKKDTDSAICYANLSNHQHQIGYVDSAGLKTVGGVLLVSKGNSSDNMLVYWGDQSSRNYYTINDGASSGNNVGTIDLKPQYFKVLYYMKVSE
jgi:hypothetical protein